MDTSILVADGDVLIDTELRPEEVVGYVRVVANPPPPPRIQDPRKQVDDRIDVGREMVACDPEILGRVDDDRNLTFFQQVPHPAEEFWGSCPAREKGYH